MQIVAVEPNASREDIDTVTSGLRAFNTQFLGPPDLLPLHVFLRGDDGDVVGGLLGHSMYGWAYIAKLWIAAEHRGRGFGRALLEAAEREAVDRGCSGVHLDTFEYQARPFYEKLGYRLFGTLEGFPPGYRQYYLAKRLGTAR
ncbi:MAG: GNAT family N-acetyltransferase [Gemmatimonas sp.]